jgi:hypothetical protein
MPVANLAGARDLIGETLESDYIRTVVIVEGRHFGDFLKWFDAFLD